MLDLKSYSKDKSDTIFWPGDANPDEVTDEELEAFIRGGAETLYHPVGTCRMGKEGERESVVDSQLRVHGVQGLRVVDASVFPSQISGHPVWFFPLSEWWICLLINVLGRPLQSLLWRRKLL